MTKHFYIKLGLIIALVVLSTTSVSAKSNNGGYGSVSCQPTYGGGTNCQQGTVSINKTVNNPKTGDMVDNLTINDPKFGPDSIVTFQLTVTNTSNVNISTATVKDVFPQFVSFNSGAGNFDSNSKTLTFEVHDLKAGESRSFTVTGKTASAADMPSNQAVTCVTNQSMVMYNNTTNQDNASFCIEKQVTSTKGGLTVYPAPKLTATPATGPEAFAFVGLIPSALAGFFLRRKTKNS